jgi:hypothetical protein
MTCFEKIMMRYIPQWDIPGRDRDDPQTMGLENDNKYSGIIWIVAPRQILPISTCHAVRLLLDPLPCPLKKGIFDTKNQLLRLNFAKFSTPFVIIPAN